MLRIHFHCSLACIGEGNGNPLQCSCLENPRNGRALWAAVYGVAQSQTQLTQPAASYHLQLKAVSSCAGRRVRSVSSALWLHLPDFAATIHPSHPRPARGSSWGACSDMKSVMFLSKCELTLQ